MNHDPERNSAAYLGGLLRGSRRRRFERHILECEDCWREVDLGRKGRALAEAGRELAPQRIRERVRAAVETLQPPRRPRWAFGAVALAVLPVVAAIFVLIPREPTEIRAVLAWFRTDHDGAQTAPQLPARLATLRLEEAERSRIGDLYVVAHRYVDRSGDVVVVYVADEEWPVALGAEHDNEGETWVAHKDGLVLICLNEPAPSFVVGDDRHDVELAAYSLRP